MPVYLPKALSNCSIFCILDVWRNKRWSHQTCEVWPLIFFEGLYYLFLSMIWELGQRLGENGTSEIIWLY